MYRNIDNSCDGSGNGGDFVAVVDDDDDNSKHKQCSIVATTEDNNNMKMTRLQHGKSLTLPLRTPTLTANNSYPMWLRIIMCFGGLFCGFMTSCLLIGSIMLVMIFDSNPPMYQVTAIITLYFSVVMLIGCYTWILFTSAIRGKTTLCCCNHTRQTYELTSVKDGIIVLIPLILLLILYFNF